MKMFDFKTWDALRVIKHVVSRNRVLNEHVEMPVDPRDIFTKEQLDEIEKSVKRKVSYAISDIMKEHPFFSKAATQITYIYSYQFKTAATDGTHMWINPLFFKDMSRTAVRFIVMHELLHCMLLHFLRRNNRHPRKWNYATDYEINLIVARELDYDMRMDPILKTGLYNEQFEGMSAEQIYDVIPMPKDDPKEPTGPIGPTGPSGSSGGGGGELTGPTGPKKPKKEGRPGPGGGGEPSGPSGPSGSGGSSGPSGPSGPSGSGGGGGGGVGEEPGQFDDVLTPEEGRIAARRDGIEEGRKLSKDDWNRIIKEAAKEHIKSKGGSSTGSSPLDKMVQQILKPKVDWRKALRRYVGQALFNEEYRIPSKRHLYKGEFRSGLWKEEGGLETIVFAMDVSGSMEVYVPGIFSELNVILKDEKVNDVIAVYFDTTVKAHEIISKGKSPDPGKIKGLGGTFLASVISWVRKNARTADLVVVISDGDDSSESAKAMRSMPRPRAPYIWIMIDHPTWSPPFGNVIHISHEDFMND